MPTHPCYLPHPVTMVKSDLSVERPGVDRSRLGVHEEVIHPSGT